ncbi:hypothetical protein PGTUg99_007854 [Puccinia graminis f. sp. tritici]|uniref:Uncharacterized protein n=1 Tax=Puccinia graminis f. sp. tritici TaxID=56615 RepID=A0A5B0S6G0_PUCGR|nr:hypothetical protein PGTUg99_007854 [Puccinia graminis f. sp. tritici]
MLPPSQPDYSVGATEAPTTLSSRSARFAQPQLSPMVASQKGRPESCYRQAGTIASVNVLLVWSTTQDLATTSSPRNVALPIA